MNWDERELDEDELLFTVKYDRFAVVTNVLKLHPSPTIYYFNTVIAILYKMIFVIHYHTSLEILFNFNFDFSM